MRIFRAALYALATLALVIAAITARVVYTGEAEISRSTEELAAGHATEAIEHAGNAAGWFAPGAPHVRVAYARLAAIATTAEGLGDRDTALFAWRAIRSASIETRWLVSPHDADRQRADAAIARLTSLAPRPPGTRITPPADIERAEREALARDESPDVAWSVVLVLGATVAGAFALAAARRSVSSTGHFDWSKGKPLLAIAALGAVAYLVAVWRA